MSTRIDHTNYEAYLLDRMEGTLSPAQEHDLEAFLLANPHLMPDDEELPSLTITKASLSNVEKKALKRCLLYTSDAADERSSVDLGGRRIIKKKRKNKNAKKRKSKTKTQ